MANVLPFLDRVRIIAMLVRGTSIRATADQCEVDKDTVMRLGVIVGLGCLVLHDLIVQAVRMALGEADELWAYVGRHARRIRPGDPAEWGDHYTMFVLDSVTKVVVVYLTGRRNLDTATALMRDLRRRVIGTPQVSVDGWPIWPEAVRDAFGANGCDLGVAIKTYQAENPRRTHNPGRVKRIDKRAALGAPNLDATSTSLAERLNLTTRMELRRVTRLTNAYSKKPENLRAALALHFAHYNLVRVHETIGTTPAHQAGLTVGPWSLARLVREALAVSPMATAVDRVADAGDLDEDAPQTDRDPSPWWRWNE